VEDGSYKLVGEGGRLLGFVLFDRGEAKSFTPHGLTVLKLNQVFQDVSAGSFGSYTLKKLEARSQPPSDLHSFYIENTNRREAWRLRKTRSVGAENDWERELEKLERKLSKREIQFA
jgi:hypothetical protein